MPIIKRSIKITRNLLHQPQLVPKSSTHIKQRFPCRCEVLGQAAKIPLLPFQVEDDPDFILLLAWLKGYIVLLVDVGLGEARDQGVDVVVELLEGFGRL